MPTLRLDLDRETFEALASQALAQRRPVVFQAEVTGISHQAMVVKEDADTVGFVLWQHLLGAPCFRAGFCSKTIIPDSEEHPMASSRTVPKAVLRWIRD